MNNKVSTAIIILVLMAFGIIFVSKFDKKSVGYIMAQAGTSQAKTDPSTFTKEDWKKKLTPGQYQLLWEKGTA